jgi:tetratricopeptide (TPR) repeat protein
MIFFFAALVPAHSSQNKGTEKNLREAIALTNKALIVYDSNLLQKAKEIFEQNNSTPTALYYRTLCEYKLLEMSSRPGNESLFENNYESGVANAEKLSELKEFESEGRTLLAAIYMMKIASNPMSAVTLTSKIHSLLDKAQNINPDNPRTYIIRGIMNFQTPADFGGSFEDAAKNFAKAIQLFEKEVEIDSIKPHWGYLESLAWMGITQEKLKNLEAAKFSYQKVLSLQPDYAWIKYSLLPKLLKKIDQELKERK